MKYAINQNNDVKEFKIHILIKNDTQSDTYKYNHL
ncbi:hypothetical protein M2101_001485 [Parabacteroides sp. PM5-20]|nr:hypothetical protein [Parabacteroides sp. PM5-20]